MVVDFWFRFCSTAHAVLRKAFRPKKLRENEAVYFYRKITSPLPQLELLQVCDHLTGFSTAFIWKTSLVVLGHPGPLRFNVRHESSCGSVTAASQAQVFPFRLLCPSERRTLRRQCPRLLLGRGGGSDNATDACEVFPGETEEPRTNGRNDGPLAQPFKPPRFHVRSTFHFVILSLS